MNRDEFLATQAKANAKLREAQPSYQPRLPRPEIIYEKEFHFLDETLLQKEQRRAAKK